MDKIIKYKYHIITFLFEVSLIVLIGKYIFGFEYFLAVLFILVIGVSEYCKGMEKGVYITKQSYKSMRGNNERF